MWCWVILELLVNPKRPDAILPQGKLHNYKNKLVDRTVSTRKSTYCEENLPMLRKQCSWSQGRTVSGREGVEPTFESWFHNHHKSLQLESEREE